MTSYWSKQFKIRKIKAIEYKGGKCLKCGYNTCPAALEFHHRDPSQKEFVWSTMRNKKWKDVLKELDKCDLLCSNCHKEEHFDPELWETVTEWRSKADSRLFEKHCKYCKQPFQPKKERITYCSHECAASARTKADWPDNLPELVAQTSQSAIARTLGVSAKAVSKRLKNHHNNLVL